MSPTSWRRVPRRAFVARDDMVRIQYADDDVAHGYATAYESTGPPARYFRSRLHVVDEALASCLGDLLDVGCGPGMFVRHLLDTRPGDFKITAFDQSPAMIDATAKRAATTDVQTVVGRIEDMPFPDRSFDVAVAMGVLDYADLSTALREMARVVRPGGSAAVTMLNPLSPYRLVEWCAYWPSLRILGQLERLLGRPQRKRHGAPKSGIRAVTAPRLRQILREVGFEPQDTVYYDLAAVPPPFDKVVRRWKHDWLDSPERTVSRGLNRWLGSGYLVVARRSTSFAHGTRNGPDNCGD